MSRSNDADQSAVAAAIATAPTTTAPSGTIVWTSGRSGSVNATAITRFRTAIAASASRMAATPYVARSGWRRTRSRTVPTTAVEEASPPKNPVIASPRPP